MPSSDLRYQSGFGNEFATEAVAGALPVGQNSPQHAPLGLYAEQLSGSPFTAPRATNKRTWTYRIRPSVTHRPFIEHPGGLVRGGPFDEIPTPPNQLRWDPFPIPDTPTDFVDGLMTIVSGKNSSALNAENLGGRLRGRRLGHFELIAPVGIGGMAAVIRARDTLLDRFVALKILPPEMALDPENVLRFTHEARAAAKLDHDNIARVFFCGEDQDLCFIAFEFVEGITLRQSIDWRGP